MEMPKPTLEHVKLERLAGHWEGEEMMHPSPWDPKGGTAIGRTRSRLALNGFAVISDYEQERNGAIVFTGHGVWSFEPKGSLYTLHWFDCMGTAPEVFVGRFDGDGLAVTHGGPGMHARMTYHWTDPQHMLTRMEMSQDGAIWKTLFDGNYRRTDAAV
jgi:hypothetical protein